MVESSLFPLSLNLRWKSADLKVKQVFQTDSRKNVRLLNSEHRTLCLVSSQESEQTALSRHKQCSSTGYADPEYLMCNLAPVGSFIITAPYLYV